MRPSPIPVFSRRMVDRMLDLVLELRLVAEKILALKLTSTALRFALSLDLFSETDRILSRRRRFLLPKFSGWKIDFDFTLTEPLGTPFGTTNTELVTCIPFTFKLDTIIK